MNSNLKAFIEGIADIVYQPEISLKRNSNFEKDDYKALKSDWEKVGNGTPQGGGEAIIVGEGFNNIEDSTWQVIFEIKDGQVIFDTMMQGSPLRVGGGIFDEEQFKKL